MAPDDPIQAPPPEIASVAEVAGGHSPFRAEAPILPRWLTCVTLGVLLVFVGVQGTTLFREWSALNSELRKAADTVVVGYLNVAVNPSSAERPRDWYRDDGDQTLLWSGWTHNVGHGWFRVGRGEVDRTMISYPLGRDMLQAIDHPLVEIEGGAIWSRVPGSAQVFGVEMGEVPSVYPLRLLDKVEVVNDHLGDRPVLVAFSPFSRIERSVGVYDAVLEGRRVTMGLSGYFHGTKPLLYDRGTESLWVDMESGLSAIAGPLKGSLLRSLTRPTPMSWSEWLSRHPRSRLLVGADRSKPRPQL